MEESGDNTANSEVVSCSGSSQRQQARCRLGNRGAVESSVLTRGLDRVGSRDYHIGNLLRYERQRKRMELTFVSSVLIVLA